MDGSSAKFLFFYYLKYAEVYLTFPSFFTRLCDTCQVVGDENHYLFSCIRLERSDSNLSGEVKEMWDHPAIFKLVYLLKSLELL